MRDTSRRPSGGGASNPEDPLPASQSRANSPRTSYRRNNPYNTKCVQVSYSRSVSPVSSHALSRSASFAGHNGFQWQSSERGHGGAPSEASYYGDWWGEVNGTLANLSQTPHHQTFDEIQFPAGVEIIVSEDSRRDHGGLPSPALSYIGTPRSGSWVMEGQVGTYPMANQPVLVGSCSAPQQHYTAADASRQHRDCRTCYEACNVLRDTQFRPTSPGEPRRRLSLSPPSRLYQQLDVAGEGDTSNEEKPRSLTSGENGSSDDNHASSREAAPTSPFFNPLEPITGFLIVKGKVQGFRYPTTLPNYRLELPVGTIVVVWRDRGEAIGEVIGHVSVMQAIRDHQRVRNIGENGLPGEAAGLAAGLGDSASSSCHSRSSSSSSLLSSSTDSGSPPLTDEPTRVYCDNAIPDAQSRVWDIVNTDTKFARILRVATDDDRVTWTRRQEKEKDIISLAKEVVSKTCRSHQRLCNDTPQGPGDNVADSAVVVAKDAECQLDGKKVTVCLSRQNPWVFVDFNRLVSRLHKKCKCRVEIRYEDEIASDNDDPAHRERMEKQRQQRETTKQPPKESCGAASPAPF